MTPSITELGESDCRFPVDRCDDGWIFCGEPRRDPKTSYCAEHHRVVWVRISKKPKAQIEEAKRRREYFGGNDGLYVDR